MQISHVQRTQHVLLNVLALIITAITHVDTLLSPAIKTVEAALYNATVNGLVGIHTLHVDPILTVSLAVALNLATVPPSPSPVMLW